MRGVVRTVTATALVATALGLTAPAALAEEPAGPAFERVTGSGGVRPDAGVTDLGLADDGTVVFSSAATNLVDGDTNGFADVFVRTAAGDVTLVSRAPGGGLADGRSTSPVISPNGRWVAYASAARNLGTADTDALDDIYLVDLADPAPVPKLVNPSRWTDGGRHLLPQDVSDAGDVVFGGGPLDADNETRYGMYRRGADGSLLRVSQYLEWAHSASISADGRWVAYDEGQVYLYDVLTGTRTRVSVPVLPGGPTFSASDPQVSDDGRYVTFRSSAASLVPGAGGYQDVLYRRDTALGRTYTVAVDSSGAGLGFSGAWSMSADGRWTAFWGSSDGWGSDARLVVRDAETGMAFTANADADGVAPAPTQTWARLALDSDGSRLVFASDAPVHVGLPAPAAGEPALPVTGIVRDLGPLRAATDTAPPNTYGEPVPTPGQAVPGLPAFTPYATQERATFECAAPAEAPVWAPCPDGPLAYDQFGPDLLVRAVDPAGNADPTPATLSDFATGRLLAPPDMSEGDPSYRPRTQDRTPTFSIGNWTTASHTYNCRVDGGAWKADCGSSYTTPTLAEGTHTFDVRRVQPGPGRQSRVARLTFDVDLTAPSFTLTPVPARTTDDSPTVRWGPPSEPVADWDCLVDGGNWGTACEAPSHTPGGLSDGAHSVTIVATDYAGNKSSRTTKFVVDRHRPQTTISSAPGATTTDRTPTFRFYANEAGSTFQCRIDSGAWTACKSGFTPTLRPGKHTFAVRAKDLGGSVDATPATKTFTVK